MQPIDSTAQALIHAGFSEKEAEIYLALSTLGTATAYEIAQHCDVKKPTVYVILEDLRKKSLVLKMPHAKKALFAAKDLEEYLREREKHIKEARSIIPQLHSLGGSPRPGVYFFTGVRGIAESLQYKLESMHGKSFRSFYGSFAGTNEEVAQFYRRWDRERVAAGTSFELLIFQKRGPSTYYEDVLQLAKSNPDHVHIRFLKEYPYPPNISVEIAEDFVRIVNDKDLQATIIDDGNTAAAFRQIFDIIWNRQQ